MRSVHSCPNDMATNILCRRSDSIMKTVDPDLGPSKFSSTRKSTESSFAPFSKESSDSLVCFEYAFYSGYVDETGDPRMGSQEVVSLFGSTER